MSLRRAAFGLSQEAKSQLMERLANRLGPQDRPLDDPPAASPRPQLGDPQVREELRQVRNAGKILGIDSPFFRAHDGIAEAETSIDGR